MFYEKIAEVAKDDPKRVAIVCGPQPVTYEELFKAVRDNMYTFMKTGVQERDIVMVDIAHPVSFLEYMIPIMSIGAVALAIPPSIGDQTRKSLMEPIHPQFVLTETEFYNTKMPASHVVNVGDLLHFTSGSSGPSKIVIRPRKNLFDEAYGVSQHLGLTGAERIMVMTPLQHSFGCGVWRACLSAGATLVVPAAFNIAAKLVEIRSLLRELLPNYVFGVPYLYQVLGSSKLILWNQTRCFAGGETLFPATSDQWLKSTGVPLQQEYGLGEGGIAVMALPNSPPSVLGRPIPGVRLKVDRPCHNAGVGELVVYRNHAPKAYLLEGPADTFMPDGGIRTGDLVSHEDGEYVFHGRIKSIIVVAGLKVTTQEIEEAIRRQPRVGDVAVIAYPDDITGERPVAFVVPEAGEKVNPIEIRACLKATIDSYKVPKQIKIVNELPRTASGKVDRNALKQHV